MTTLISKMDIRRSLYAGIATAALIMSPAIMGAATAAPANVESQRHFDKAAKYAKDDNPAAAIIELKNAIVADGANSTARYELALLYLRTGDALSAQRELETARARGFDETKLSGPLAQAYFAQGKFRDVVTKFDPTKLNGDPRVDLLATQARAHIALNDRVAARGLIDQALALNAERPSALVADTILLRLEGDFPGAEKQLDKALTREKNQPEFLVLKAELRQQQKDFTGAQKQLDAIIQRQPDYLRAYVARAVVKLNQQDAAGAKADIDYVLNKDNRNNMAHYLNAYLLVRDHKYREASQLLIGQTALIERFPPAAYLLAAASFSDNRPEIARTWAQRYVTQVPDDIAGAKLLAAIYQRQKNSAKAVEVLEQFAARNPNDTELNAQLANAYLGAGRSDRALEMFEQGVAQNPGDTSAQLALAAGRLQMGDLDQGTAQLQKVLDINPGSLQANTMMVLTQLRGRMPEKALKTTASMIKANPNDPNSYNLDGTAHLAANDIEAARTAFTTALNKDPSFVAAALNLARIEERRGDEAAARKWYTEALRMDPKNVTAFDGLANLALRNGDYEAAVKQYELSITRDPTATQPRLKLVELLLERSDNARALNAARDFAAATPDDFAAMELLGRAQIANGDITNGIGSYRRLTNEAASNPEAHRRLGRAYAAAAAKEKNNASAYLAEARIAFDRALEISPDFEPALADRLMLEGQLKGADAAIALGQRLVAARPASIVRLVVLGDAQTAAQKPAAAAATYQKAWNTAKDGAILRRLYGALVQSQRGNEGLALLKTWVNENPADYSTRLMITSHYINTKQYDVALKETEAMNGVLPDNPVVLNNLAWLYGEKNDPKAITVAEKAFALAPRSADIADTLGWLQVQKGNVAKGVEILGKAHALAPERSDITYRYAVALEKSGDKVQAKTVLQKALSAKVTFTERPQAEALLKQLGS
ncbi:MAG: XrtA/PEP-CTERM system TPR-repeat protein PrsT [Rhodospirillaceae bacterium]